MKMPDRMAEDQPLVNEGTNLENDRTYDYFQYKPLQAPTEIRLVKLYPKGAELSIAIVHKNLSEMFAYSGVSYKWNGDALDETVNVVYESLDNTLSSSQKLHNSFKRPGHTPCVLRVSRSIKLMLENLRDSKIARYLWIDALCIDQNDIIERNRQVAIMGRIYSQANFVIAYLDDVSSGERVELVNHPYFRRRWVIQEICLARSVTIYHSGDQLPWSLLEQSLTRKNHRSDKSSSHLDNGKLSSTASRALAICRLRQQMMLGSPSLASLLIENENAECSDIRDKVYALLSLSQTAKERLPVDYSIRPLDLVLSVLYVCGAWEKLTSSYLMSFACFLMRNLHISDNDLKQGMTQDVVGIVPRGTIFPQQIVLRGIISSTYVDGDAETTIYQHRLSLPSLLQRSPVEFDRVSFIRPPSHKDTSGIGWKFVARPIKAGDRRVITPLEQWRFSFRQLGKIQNTWDFSREYCAPTRLPPFNNRSSARQSGQLSIYAGVSSVATEPGDEIWQFPGAPVAFIARKILSDHALRSRGSVYALVGRALIFATDLSVDATNGPPLMNHKLIEMTVPHLLELTAWANLDWGEDHSIHSSLSTIESPHDI